MVLNISHFLYDHLKELGTPEAWARILNLLGLSLFLLLLVFVIDFILRRVIRSISVGIAHRTHTHLDDIAISNNVPKYLAHILPLYIAIKALPIVFVDYDYWGALAFKLGKVLVVILFLNILKSVLKSIRDYLRTLPRYMDKPIDSYIQVVMIVGWCLALVAIFAIVTETTIWTFFTALGAASAVILLIFKDSILGFVASIQVSMNDMVRIGDWITMDKYGADGDVIEITLATVKIQNFDKTITTVPTYALISDSFKNWRGMSDSGGRRIKRSLFIKQSGIKYLDQEEIQALKKIYLLTSYLENRENKINDYNTQNDVDKSLLINGRNLTNIGVFRKYMQLYLESHSAVNKDMTLMTRQLQPTTQGIPIEVYVFSADKRWANYEYIMSDIFDHFLASVPYFNLELFELPSHLN